MSPIKAEENFFSTIIPVSFITLVRLFLGTQHDSVTQPPKIQEMEVLQTSCSAEIRP